MPVQSSKHLVTDAYRREIAAGRIVDDASQKKAIRALDALAQQLVDDSRRHWLTRLLDRLLHRPTSRQGVYLWGGVGRGKSFAMDLFFAVVPGERKLRIHFHQFMKDTERAIGRLTGQANSLDLYASELARDYDLICFDELHVNDVVEAMFMGRIFESLLKTPLRFCVTSNYAPEQLYAGGLNRDYLLPAIDLFLTTFAVMRVDNGVDYRHRESGDPRYFLYPASAAPGRLDALYRQFNGHETGECTIELNHRTLHAIKAGQRVIWLDFAELCDSARSKQDYLTLATRYPVVMLANVPKMDASSADAARRFTWLIDILYDRRNILIVSADAPVDDLYKEGQQAAEFVRTASRLKEMQTGDYVLQALKNAGGFAVAA